MTLVIYYDIFILSVRQKESDKMKRKLNEIWKAKEGSKTVWKVQAEKGILTFIRKRDAIKWVESFK